jgi:sterol desaturase/sphingolipid hydroxylase (fatty acid hydroxylase superfamily)
MNSENISFISFWSFYILIGNLFPIFSERHVYRQLFLNILSTFIMIQIFADYNYHFHIPHPFKFFVYISITGIYFYFVHRALHIPSLYKYHKKHHEYIHPFALTGLYCSIFEMIFLNFTSLYIPSKFIYLTKHEMIFICLLFSFNILKGHSGFKKGFLSNIDHENHHIYKTSNYCVLPFNILDKIFSTYKK